MANQLLTTQLTTRESLMILANNLVAIPRMYRDLDQEFGKRGGKVGDTIYVRKPPRFLGRDGQAFSPEALTDTSVPVAINQQSGVDFDFSTQEEFLSLDMFRTRYLMPAMESLTNKLDFRALQTMALNTPNNVGTIGTVPGLSSTDAFQIYAAAGQKLDEMGFPMKGDRTIILTPSMRTGYLAYTKQFFNPSGGLSKQWQEAQISNALGYEWYVDQNLPTLTVGTLGGTPAVNGAGQTGSTLLINGASNSITNWAQAGDIITIATVFAVNPQSRVSTGALQQFTVQQAANSDGSGNVTLSIFPAIQPTGQFQNVTQSPGNGALISVYGANAAGQAAISAASTPQAILFHKQAFTFVSFPGKVPQGVNSASVENDPDTGVSLRFVQIFDGYRDAWVNRFDVYYGIAPLYPEGACRINS